MILEGDFIAPELCKKLMNESDRIKCIIITEDDPNQIIQNYFDREARVQTDRSALMESVVFCEIYR